MQGGIVLPGQKREAITSDQLTFTGVGFCFPQSRDILSLSSSSAGANRDGRRGVNATAGAASYLTSIGNAPILTAFFLKTSFFV
jgi:hypothetical protein